MSLVNYLHTVTFQQGLVSASAKADSQHQYCVSKEAGKIGGHNYNLSEAVSSFCSILWYDKYIGMK